MPKLENAVTHFKVDSIPYPKNTVNYQIQNEDTVGLYSVNDPEHRIIKGTLARFDDWTDLNDDPYTSFTQLTDDLDSFLFYISGDYNLEVLRGNIIGHEMVSISGHNDDATTTRVVVAPTLTTSDIDQSGIHASASTVKVASTDANDTSAGTGLRTLTLEGLDDVGNEQEEIITLDGQNEVTSSKEYSAINGFIGLTAGSNNTSAGDIWVGNGTFTAGVPDTKYFVSERNHNHGLTAYRTVPASKTLFLRGLTFSVVGTNKEVEITIETSTDNGNLWIIEDEISGTSGMAFHVPAQSFHEIPARTHIRVRAEAAGSGSELTVVLACELIDD